jgi:hypothetical protein
MESLRGGGRIVQDAVLTLREKRVLFTRLLAHWIRWVDRHPGWETALGEGYVALTDAADGDYDGPHKKGGAHYTGLGNDMLLYINGVYVKDGAHPAWVEAGAKWEGMHELCRWGGRWGDANHLSLEHEGRA